MSQIFTGTEPLMGTSNEILKAATATFQSEEKESGKGAGEDLQQGGVPMDAGNYLKFEQIHVFCKSTTI